MTRTVLAQKKPIDEARLQSELDARELGIDPDSVDLLEILDGPAYGAGSSLDSLTDVIITSASNGQVLKFNGTHWVNATDETGGGGGGGGANLSVSTTSSTVVIASDSGTDATITAATGSVAGIMTAAMFTTLSSALQQEFETVSKNLKSYPATLSYTGSTLNSIAYTTPSGTITKTLNYTGDKLTSVVLSGATPSGIELTKTLIYTADNLTGIAYS
jgi:hypothetical protein